MKNSETSDAAFAVKRKPEILGHTFAIALSCVFVLFFTHFIYQFNFWERYFFSDTFPAGEDCSYRSKISNSPNFPDLSGIEEKSVKLPHFVRSLVGSEGIPKNQTAHLQINCKVDLRVIEKSPGISILFFGYIYGEKIQIFVGDELRAAFKDYSIVYLPLKDSDIENEYLYYRIETSSSKSDLTGVSGKAPVRLAIGREKTERIYGVSAILSKVKYIFDALPALTLCVFFILAWFFNLRSRLLVSTFFYFLVTTTLSVLNYMVDILPIDLETLLFVSSVTKGMGFLALSIIALQLFGMGQRWIRFYYPAIIIFGSVQAVIIFKNIEHFEIFQRVLLFNNFINAILAVVLSSFAIRKMRSQSLARDQKWINTIFICGYVFAGVTYLFDSINVYWFNNYFNLSDKLELFMPFFVGGVVIYQLSLIRRNYELEKGKREKMERDLDTAREIQNSLTPPPEKTMIAGLQLCCYEKKHSQVAGDWMAVHQGKDLIFMICDVTGKGLQAALVVHAIQSLWAEATEAMNKEGFDISGWLKSVNRTLFKLGEKKPHSATMGLLKIDSSQKITYWCQGHTPAYATILEGNNRRIIPLLSTGSIIGLSPHLEVHPAEIQFKSADPWELILTSDGVLEHGSRTKKSEILSLFDSVSTKGGAALDELWSDDDRTIIWIKNMNPSTT